jgi:hypothetical protein
LAALHLPVPRPTKAAVAQNKAEDESRRENTTLTRLISVVRKGPDVEQASKIGEPTLVDPTPVAANQDALRTTREAMGLSANDKSLTGEIVKSGTPGANEPTPRSDTANANTNPSGNPFSNPPAAGSGTDNELTPNSANAATNAAKPSGAGDPNELTPSTDARNTTDQPLPPPAQINEIQQGQAAGAGSTASTESSSALASDKDISSSKKKKKKGLRKILPL